MLRVCMCVSMCPYLLCLNTYIRVYFKYIVITMEIKSHKNLNTFEG